MAVNRTSPIRLTGMNSGLDTQSIVTSLMKLEHMKVDKQFKAKVRLEWRRDSYREVNNWLRTLKDDYSTVTKQQQNMLSQINYRVNKATLKTETNAVSITATSSAQAGSTTINSIKQLAKGASVTGGAITGGDTLNINRSVADVFGDTINYHYKSTDVITEVYDAADKGVDNPALKTRTDPQWFSFTVNGETFTFNKESSIATVMNTVNASTNANVTLSYSQLTGRFMLSSKQTGMQSELEFDEVVQPEIEMSLQARKVWATYEDDKITEQEDFSAEDYVKYGDKRNITQNAGASNFFSAMKLDKDEDTGQIHTGQKITDGRQNAQLYINNTFVERSSNRFTIDGVSYTLNREYNTEYVPGPGASSEGIEFTVAQDVDSTFNMIKNYIEAYNTLIAKLNSNNDQAPGRLNEKVYRHYEPITDEERANLSETQIKQWEEKAKSGILRRDSALTGLVNQLRGHFYSKVGDTDRIMAQIGLTTTRNYLDGGQIEIDEDKLRKAIAENPDEVYQMFAGTGTAGGTQGLARKINSSIDAYIKQNERYALVSNDEALRRADSRLNEMQEKLFDIEERYWAKFTAMERAIAALNSQSGWLSAQLGSLNK